MKRRGIAGIIVLGLVLISTIACNGGEETTTQPPTEAITRIVSDGNLSSSLQRSLSFATSGTIKEINVEEGDFIKAGEILARLDGTTEEQTAKMAELNVKNSEVAIKVAEIDLEIATDKFEKITYPYTYYTFAFGVPEALGAISSARIQIEELEDIASNYADPLKNVEVLEYLKKAKNNLITAQEKLDRGQGEDPFFDGQLSIADFWTLREAQLAVEQAQLNLERNRNLLEQAQENLEWTKTEQAKTEAKTIITAPFDGMVSKVEAKEGEFLSPTAFAGTTIIEIIDLRHMELIARVDELDVVKVKTGQKVMISVDAMPGTMLEGRVTFISPVAREPRVILFEDDDEEKDYEVKIDFDIPEGSPIRAGMSATAEIIVE